VAVSAELIATVRASYALAWHGLHGLPHWVRVRDNGLRLAPATGATPTVVELFALFHDAGRRNDHLDPRHGRRAAELVATMPAELLGLSHADREVLQYACAFHTAGLVDGDVTVQTCWDADRLDLGRVGTRPDPSKLCTAAARQPELIEWAWQRSRRESPDGW